MANKTSGNQGSSGEADGRVPRVSRKVIAKTSAPYERKTEEGGAEKASEGQPVAGEKGEAAASAAAPEAGKAEGKGGKDARKESGGRKEARDGHRAPEQPSVAAAEPAAPAASAPPAAAAPEPASPEPASPAPAAAAAAPAPAPASEYAPPPELDPAAEFAQLLPPRFIQSWDPNTPAPPPAKAPPGDSRSFRRRGAGVEEFVLIYRSQTFLIRRAGRVGVLGTWTITEYPHVGAAAHAYAQQCSELTAAGFRDLR